MPIGLMAGVAAASTIAQTGIGISQYFKGKKQEKELERPTYQAQKMQMPDEIYNRQALAMGGRLAQQGIPEQQRQLYLQNLQRGTSNAMAQMGSRKAGLIGLGALNEQQNQGYQHLLGQDAQARMANQQNLMNLQSQTAGNIAQADMATQQFNIGQDEQAFTFNEINPYYEGVAQSQGLMGAGMQNIMSGVGNIGQLASTGGLGGVSGTAGKTGSISPPANVQTINPVTTPGLSADPGLQTMAPSIAQPMPQGLNTNLSHYQ